MLIDADIGIIKNFKTAILSILHLGRLDPLEMDGKIEDFSQKIQAIKKN